MLAANGRAEYYAATDDEALDGLPAARRDRGDRARARTRARDRLARARGRPHASRKVRPCSSRSRAAATRTRRRSPSGSDSSSDGSMTDRSRSAPARARRDAGRKLLVPYVTGGLGREWCDVVRAGHRRRRRRGRDRHPVLRPDHGRPHDPGSEPARARSRRDAGRRDRRARPTIDAPVPLIVMTYYNLICALGHERVRAGACATSGVERRDPSRSSARRARRLGRRRRRGGRGDGPPRGADHSRRPAGGDLRAVARASSTACRSSA